MTNNYYNYVRNLLTIFAAFFVFGNAGAQSTDRTKAFGYAFTAEELSQYPQKTDVPTVYLEIYKTTYPLNEKGKAVATTTMPAPAAMGRASGLAIAGPRYTRTSSTMPRTTTTASLVRCRDGRMTKAGCSCG